MIHFVVALPAEAKPLIQYFGLKRSPHRSLFAVYESPDVRLIISGSGKTQAASATAYLHSVSGEERNQAWFNIGIGGHADCPLGEGVLAHKVKDEATGQSWYPPLLLDLPCRTYPVLTVDRVEKAYRDQWIYEMEASGFFATASRCSTMELIHCFKVVSDNRASSCLNISSAFVTELIESNLETIEWLARQLAVLARKLQTLARVPPVFDEFIKRWHFTVSEQHRLRRLLKRWAALKGNEDIWSDGLAALPDEKEALRALEDKIDSLPVTL